MNEHRQIDADWTDWRRLLTSAERADMLTDIARVALAVGTVLFPDQPWSELKAAAGKDSAPKSPLEQLSFLEARLPILTQALGQIAQSPFMAAAVRTASVPVQNARRVTVPAWMAHARQGVRRVEETISVLTSDTPENRVVKSFVQALEWDSRSIAQIAEAEEEAEACERAMRCARHLHRLLPEAWREEVISKPGDWTRQTTQQETLRPAYACVARERSRYRQRFCFDWSHPLLSLPARETWRLYELWCLMTVLQALRELGWKVIPTQDILAVREGRLTLTPETGERSRVHLHSAHGTTLTLTYHQTFGEGRESLTHTMQPDITLSSGAHLWILDSKFKAYSEPGEEGSDINQMHAYRDAIVSLGGTRNVAHAWCLYAGLAGTPNRSQITYGRSTDTAIGALCLRPGSDLTRVNLRCLLSRWLSSGRLTEAV